MNYYVIRYSNMTLYKMVELLFALTIHYATNCLLNDR